jgi:HNH endonuclease
VPFPDKEAAELLAHCHRRCCVCHRFCGFKMELDHIDPKANGGSDTIDNAIPVCFECHAEIHAYNDKHPRGRKYRPEELKKHKEQWLKLCTKSAAFASPVPARTDVGPFQALIDELEFNRAVAASTHDKHAIPLFETAMFDRCVSEGILSLLNPALKSTLIDTYVVLRQLNTLIDSISNFPANTDSRANTVNAAWDSLRTAQPVNLIEKTITVLTQVLSREN